MSSKGPCIGQRHILVFWAAFGFLIVYCMRVNMSVALVAMVDQSALQSENETVVTECSELIEPASSVNSTPYLPVHGEFKWSRQLQGLILSSFFWGYGILQVPAGTFSQKWGGKWIFGFGVVLTAILTLLTPIAARVSVYLLIVIRFIEGLGESITYPALQAMLGRWSPKEESSFLLTLCLVGSALGSIVGQITAGPLSSSTFLGGWPSVFYIDGGVALIWFLPWCLCVFDSPISNPRITAAERLYIERSAAKNQDEANSQGVPWRKIFKDRAVWAYIVGFSAYGWVFNTILTTLPQFLSDILHFDIKSNGIISAMPFIGLAVSQIICSYSSDQLVNAQVLPRTWIRKIFTLGGFFGIGGCMIGVNFTGCNVLITVFLLILTLIMAAMLYGGVYANAYELSPEFCGTIFGISNSVATITGIIAPIVTDKITEVGTRAQWNEVFWINAGIAFFGGCFYLFFGSANKRDWVQLSKENQPIFSPSIQQSNNYGTVHA